MKALHMGNKQNITIFTGTKAMFIKLVPIALEFEKRGWPYRIIDTGQHAALVHHIIEQFGLNQPDVSLDPEQKGVSTITGGIGWIIRVMAHLTRSPAKLRDRLFGGEKGISLIHGDTMSTLLSCLIAKRAGQRVAHVEAGLRSNNYLHPFPEEIVRVLVMKMADILFAPSPSANHNLEKMGLAGKAHLLPGNTNLDTLQITLNGEPGKLPPVPEKYSMATVHRLETLYNRKRLDEVISTLIAAHNKVPLVFIMHPPTAKRLRKYGLEKTLIDAGVTIHPLMDHSTFLHLLKGAQFVVTDGGSIQEEVSYLGVPCLLLRKTTERDEGIGKNVVLSGMKRTHANEFLENYLNYKREADAVSGISPSSRIVYIITGSVAPPD
jgi:UDP-N-acetylglucosamine 2-epimerase